MDTTNLDIQQMLITLEQIETLALLGSIPGCLTGLTARLLSSELRYSETQAEALERARAFVRTCELMVKA